MITYIRKMAVEPKKWVDGESLQEGVTLCQAIPGATAMQMAAYIGLKVRGVCEVAASSRTAGSLRVTDCYRLAGC